jgi:pre-mRNA-processing factor SLU7
MSSDVKDFKKRKEESAKKQSGEMAPDVDQDGKMINPHNPDFITKVPWYLGNNSGPTLKHHSIQKADHFLSMNEADELISLKNQKQRELDAVRARPVFKKGCCKNCGSATHKEKDCTERPRSAHKAAWKSGLDIAPDEVVMDLADHGKVSYSAKRDSWKGYDASHYSVVVDKFQRMEDERKAYRKQELETLANDEQKQLEAKKEARKAAIAAKREDKGNTSDNSHDSDSDSDSDYDSDADDRDESGDEKDFLEGDANAKDFQSRVARQGGVGGNEMKVTARNLRIREDTPKYLRNLDLDSAHYDPKSRSMRANPFPNENPENLPFAGDNFVRATGDALALAQTQVMCWELGTGGGIDVISNPSQAELLKREAVQQKKVAETAKRDSILEKYGSVGTQASQVDPRLRLGQSEVYVEYSWDGRIVKGVGKQSPKSKYDEDVKLNNHTSIWGSYYNKYRHRWGFACCHSLLKNSYCTGEVGKYANDAANEASLDANQTTAAFKSQQSQKAANDASNKKRNPPEGEIDDSKLKTISTRGENKYGEMKMGVTSDEMEEYKQKRSRREDPMANFVDSEDI